MTIASPLLRIAPRVLACACALGTLAIATGCGSSASSSSAREPSDAGFPTLSSAPPDAGANEPLPVERPADAGYAFAGGELSGERFVTKVVSFQPGPCAGFGASAMPDIVFGPPHGAGDQEGGFDVVSLGVGGTVVLGFDDAIVDGPGDDFVVFENAFYAGGDPSRPAADLGEISVSDDGTTWATFACTATAYPYGACAGWHPVFANADAPDHGISPTAPGAGGDRFDLATVGVARARFVRIRDMHSSECPDGAPIVNLGFDLDAVVSLNAERP
jgi:hypothetical protein